MGEMPATAGVCDTCAGEVYQRDDDTVEAATKRLNDYDAITSQLVPYYSDEGPAAPASTATARSTPSSLTSRPSWGPKPAGDSTQIRS